MRKYKQISAKTLGEMRKNTHEGVQPKNFKSPLLRRFIYSLLFKAKGTRVMLGGHKKYSNPLCASSYKAKTSAKLRLLRRQLNPPYGRRISPERQ